MPWIGITAGTGSGFENHVIINWEYYNTFDPTPVGSLQLMPVSLISETLPLL